MEAAWLLMAVPCLQQAATPNSMLTQRGVRRASWRSQSLLLGSKVQVHLVPYPAMRRRARGLHHEDQPALLGARAEAALCELSPILPQRTAPLWLPQGMLLHQRQEEEGSPGMALLPLMELAA